MPGVARRHPARVVLLNHRCTSHAREPQNVRVGLLTFGPSEHRYGIEIISVAVACLDESLPSILRGGHPWRRADDAVADRRSLRRDAGHAAGRDIAPDGLRQWQMEGSAARISGCGRLCWRRRTRRRWSTWRGVVWRRCGGRLPRRSSRCRFDQRPRPEQVTIRPAPGAPPKRGCCGDGSRSSWSGRQPAPRADRAARG